MREDYAVRATAHGGTLRAFAARTTELVKELQRRHHTWPVATAALGRAVTVGAMMGLMLKGERDRLTIQIKGNGPLGQIVVDADSRGHVRGYVDNPAVDLPLNDRGKLDVAGAVGEGMLYVVKDLGLKEPYRGSVPLVSGELGEDFTYYFTVSEQIPSAVGVGVLVDRDGSVLASGGFILQVLPEAEEETIARLEERIAAMTSVTDRIQAGAAPEDLLREVIGEDVQVLQRQPVSFDCSCSPDRIRSLLKSMGKEEISALLQKQGKAEVICHFCSERYVVEREELEKWLGEMK
ncbi:molecular chaperone Hsp33 [Planifilum fulgidum]|jgi:molecular chaperone Hsp33|uniref:33 kDa chaperonin n=1 Tax=Planifilum fulgidum TaxID=201973 RepID=A0A1I2PW03_9BACL|nr:Hsp33 family molecular chaperone HslO [Planifilum fulgidum]MBO2497866.1 Hsp33 family molecular chaperone HslO [Bacillota bacterium]MBO2533199.1 Hsp33 family molecular chaperone HslO [Thermoactinomycetaceae bacterium]SFG20244.1 molecular chaperone Hsp33 [Planifilum fulgidum]